MLLSLWPGEFPELQAQEQAGEVHRYGTDFSNTDFETDEAFIIDGNWQFYNNALLYPDEFDLPAVGSSRPVKLPHLWNEDPALDSFGYATYRTIIHLPEEYPSLALSIPDFYTSYRLYVNGELLTGNGVVDSVESAYRPYWLPQTISLPWEPGGTIEMVIHVANFKHSKGGVRLPLLIGSEKYLHKKRTIELTYSVLLGGAVLMIGLFFFGLYAFGGREQTFIYFALFCLAYTYRLIGTDLYALHYLIPMAPWWLTVTMEYLTLYLGPVAFGMFIQSLYPDETQKTLQYIFITFFGLLGAAVILLPAYYFTALIDVFFSVVPGYILFILWICIRAFYNKRKGSGFALAAIVVVSIIFLYNLLEYKSVLQENLLFDFVGYFSFFFLQSLILSYRFAWSLNKAREKAEESAQAKSQFLSTMSHEIRTPLNAVIGLSELMLTSDSGKKKDDYARSIKQSGENLLDIVNNILDFSKFESSEVHLQKQAVHLENTVAEIIQILRPLSNEKKLNLSYRKVELTPEWIYTDPTRLKQVLTNLVGNAIKFTSKGGVDIKVTRNHDPGRKGNLLFAVTDTGPGIPEKKYHRLFRSFSQLDSGPSREFGGSGLGLAISKKIVEALEGEIWFKSEERIGSTFYFTIQAEKAEGLPEEKSAQKSASEFSSINRKNPESLNVLIAEDQIINQQVALSMLKNIGIRADVAQNGKEAVEQYNMNDYDLILMDMEMPVMNGLDATRLIRQLEGPVRKCVIIAMTANAFAEDKKRCLDAGMNDFISKPVSVQSLREKINEWTRPEQSRES